jgi:hypothetical protein
LQLGLPPSWTKKRCRLMGADRRERYSPPSSCPDGNAPLGHPFLARGRGRVPMAARSRSCSGSVELRGRCGRPAGMCSAGVPCSTPTRSRPAFRDVVPRNEVRRVVPRSR